MIPLPLKHQQQGVTLLTALMLLFIITLLTLNSVNTTLLDSKIANNLRDSDLSFQTAEITLKEAEKYLHNTTTLPVFNDTNGLLPYEPETTRDLADDNVWDSFSHTEVSLPTILHIATPPEYVIEQLPSTGNNGTLEAGTPHENSYYQVTAKSKGATGNSVVVLQAVIKR
jgi:type IV pilus assembly protein PilX